MNDITSWESTADASEEHAERKTKTVSLEGEVEAEASDALASGHSSVVAAHYNALEEKGVEARKNSRIFHLRNFNNWIKSMLIKEYTQKLQNSKQTHSGLKVLDMCCGKGGDLLKWRKANVSHLICADIAGTSVEQCKSRYEENKMKSRDNRNKIFSCEFITADCTRERLRSKYSDVTMKLDLVSCQFSFHYSFESLPQVETMLQNAAECLRAGGYFIGSIPDSADIIRRLRDSDSKIYQNSLFRIELCVDEPYPLFGAKYNFYLEGVVDCPEFLVHFPTLIKLAARAGLKFVHRERFSDFYERMKNDGRFLLKKMQALETYPANSGNSLAGPKEEYAHADVVLLEKELKTVGTLSKSEWEAISLYQIFVFEKMEISHWATDGKPVFKE